MPQDAKNKQVWKSNGQIQRKHIEWSLWMVLESTKGVSVLLSVNILSILILHKVQWLKKSCRIGPKEHYSMLSYKKQAQFDMHTALQ